MATDLWSAISDREPEISARKDGVTHHHGPVDGHRCSLVSMPGRVDLFISPPEDSADLPPNVGPHADAFAAVGVLGSKLTAKVETVVRIGVGGVVLHFVNSKDDAYAMLDRRFPCMELATSSAGDFLLQLNRTVDSTVGPVTLNRIVRWAYLPLQRIQLPAIQIPAPAGALATSGPAVTTMRHAVRLDIDANTAAAHVEPFPQEQAAAFVHELASAALDLIGDALRE